MVVATATKNGTVKPPSEKELEVLASLANGRKLRRSKVTKKVKGVDTEVMVLTVVSRSGKPVEDVKAPRMTAVESSLKKGLIIQVTGSPDEVGLAEYQIADAGRKALSQSKKSPATPA